ncbi:MAG: hypothetical protein A3H96_22850 [Acidobacteria bacterium RIFCSPLOWO2_02_FULL_67_36]|nr:MAG: hypothetical protein A3H96_22850 [Acidobacteria bacterium RIFCSPLOWO2_02_FULL_67_36]OFW26373.1 MAG: hypothetical protein A3G21_27185 [Acidobacteria bacterium RIFCSPLOWO2_12_FULL_66_21]
MRPLPRGHRLAVILWLVIGLLVWNGVYDLILGKGLKEYLFRAALHEAGRGPAITIESVMDAWRLYAVWVATLWASIIVLAGMVTIKLAGRREEAENVERRT